MRKDHSILVVLLIIVLLNILAIVLLSNRLERQSPLPQFQNPQAGITSPIIATPKEVVRNDPAVTTLILEDKRRCPQCFDIRKYITALNETILMNVEMAEYQEFNTPRLPALAFNKTIEQYPTIVEGWENTGYIINISSGKYAGTWYVFPTANPPYYSFYDNRTRGIVTAIIITKKDCQSCYDTSVLRGNLDSLGIVFKERIVAHDSEEGVRLIREYNITSIPTIIMDKEADEYLSLWPGWGIVGTVESDGSYVLRDLQRIGVTYYDLSTSKLMIP